MYAFTPAQLRSIADYVEAQNEGLVGNQDDELSIQEVVLYGADAEALGKVSFDLDGAFGFIFKKVRGY